MVSNSIVVEGEKISSRMFLFFLFFFFFLQSFDQQLSFRLCWEKFGWSSQKADELLLPVLKEYNKHEVFLVSLNFHIDQ